MEAGARALSCSPECSFSLSRARASRPPAPSAPPKRTNTHLHQTHTHPRARNPPGADRHRVGVPGRHAAPARDLRRPKVPSVLPGCGRAIMMARWHHGGRGFFKGQGGTAAPEPCVKRRAGLRFFHNEHEDRRLSSRQPRPGGLRCEAGWCCVAAVASMNAGSTAAQASVPVWHERVFSSRAAKPHLVVHGAPPARNTRNETPTRSGRVRPTTRRRPTTCGSRGRGTPARAALPGPAAAGPVWSTPRRSNPGRTWSTRQACSQRAVSARPACPFHTRTDGSSYRAAFTS